MISYQSVDSAEPKVVTDIGEHSDAVRIPGTPSKVCRWLAFFGLGESLEQYQAPPGHVPV